PAPTGVYYIGFHAYSLPDEFRLYLDSINVRRYSLVDVGATAVTFPTCPGNTTMQATIFNYNLTPLNFAVNPVTVTATLTGAAATTLTATVNTGTLAPGASLVVPIPVYNFIAGNYNLTVATGSADDLQTANNSIARTLLVNPSPTAAVFTPSAPQICTNGIVQLNTQFTGTGNPKVTWSPITGLYVNALGNMIYTAGTDAYTVWAKPATTTTYTVTTTNLVTGCTTTSTVTVTVNSNSGINLTALPARICTNDPTIALTASPAGGVWTGVGVSGSNFVPAIVTPGSFTLTYAYTNTFGCTTTGTTVAKVESCPERIRLLRDNAVVLYPNPNQGKFSILINSVLYSNLIMKVYSESGNLVRTQSLSGLTYGRVIPFDLTNLPAGTYMVQFIYDGGVRSSEKTFKVLIGR
ncbi:MAG: T9SS type A sorting domain-containing protein, partial [Chitinophagaceae bacterium]